MIGERRRGIERDKGQLMDAALVATLENDAAQLTRELSIVDERLCLLGPELATLEADEQSFQHDRDDAVGMLSAVGSTGAASAAAEVRGELRSLRSAFDRVGNEHRQAIERHLHVTARHERVHQELVEREREHAEALAKQVELSTACEAAAGELAAAERDSEALSVQRDASADDVSRWTARAEALQLALDAAHARAGAEALAGTDGVLGTLLDLVEIDAGWEDATEAAMGEALQAVVVRDSDAARRALDALRSSDTSGAVLALGLASTTTSAPPIGDPVRPHVRAVRGDVGALLDVLLADAVRVADVVAAADAAIAYPHAVAVTAAGDRYGPTGWRVGAATGGGATAAALEDAQHKAEAAAASLATIEAATRSARERVTVAHQRARETSVASDANDFAVSNIAAVIHRDVSQLTELESEIESLAQTIAEQATHLDRERGRIAEFESIVPRLELDEAAEAEAAKVRNERQAQLDARAALLASRRRDVEVRAAGLTERKELLEHRIAETERRLAADAAARTQAADRRIALERTLTALQRLETFVEAHRLTIDAEHAELSERRRRQSDEVRQLAAKLEQSRRDRVDTEHRLEADRERPRRVEIDETEARLRLENAVEMLRRDLDTEPDVAEKTEQPPLPDGVTAKARVRELERELRLLGPINPLALEEFNELQQRHSFLEEQLDDVRTTRRELARVIKAVDHEIQTVFSAAFADVGTNFSQLFETLFPGGTGKLVLTQPDDMLNTGIDVEAKPSGKNVKKLSLLSGGERSLTALAFLFAVFRSRPSPFYVMDEVEAALDDVNLHRFLGLIAEFRQEAQLLIVSHQKRTMEAGDCLLGVTMQPGGSSTVITERVA